MHSVQYVINAINSIIKQEPELSIKLHLFSGKCVEIFCTFFFSVSAFIGPWQSLQKGLCNEDAEQIWNG